MQRYNRIQFIFVQVLCVCMLLIYGLLIKFLPTGLGVSGLLAILVIIAVINIIIIIRRLHDIGLSGYWVIALILLSIIGKFFPDAISVCIDTGIMLVFALLPGDKAENVYGPPSEKRWSLR